ncbi:glycosyltransferase [Fictibacillus iocasae]|uniref:Glycosyltransferase n=1 Tax=Fictibacillus iocasae TaxID=2715437 RepID=A0ABW2NPK8_9BACL
MLFLYISLFIFLAFVGFQTLYILIPLFKNEKKNRLPSAVKHRFSVLVPAYNEEKVIGHCVFGFRQLNYEHAELIIINDGSTDNTMDYLRVLLDLEAVSQPFSQKLPHEIIRGYYRSSKFSNVYVIDKYNGGKADSLNAGINFSQHDLVVTLDADSILAPDSLMEMNENFQDEKVIACGGNVLITQGFSGGSLRELRPTFNINGVIRFQFLQYLTAFYLHKRAQAALGAITVIAGAFGAFRREVLFQIGGFRKTIGEDMDITLKLHKRIKENNQNERIAFEPHAICYTECPGTLKDMFKQRVRWQKAFIDCLFYYKDCYFRKFTARFSIFFLIDQFIIGTLNAFPVVIAPFVLLFYKSHFILLVLLGLGAVFLFTYQSLTTIVVSSMHGVVFRKRDIVKILAFLPFEIFIFRMINLSFVVYGTLSYFGKPKTWDKMERTGVVSWKEV